MRTKPVLLAVCLLFGACSSSGGSRGNQGTGGEEETGGSPGTGGVTSTGGAVATGGKTGSTGGAPGTGGAMMGTGGAGDGGSGGGTGGSPQTGGSGGGGASGGATGTGGAVSASGCMGVMSSFCDDFEAQATGAAPKGMFTTKIGGGATFNIETTKAYSGTKAAHIHVPKGAGGASDPTAQMGFTSQFPVAMNDLHGRVMVFLTKNPNDTGKPNIHWDLLTASGGGKTYTLGSMYNDVAKTGAFMPVYQPGDRSIDTSTPFPVGRWACVQWQFRFGGAGGDWLEIKMDGKVVDLGKTTAEGAPIMGGHIAAWPAGPWARMSFGYVHFSSPTPIDVDLWFDDLAFGGAEIPCPAAK
jgi:hypothetical protein